MKYTAYNSSFFDITEQAAVVFCEGDSGRKTELLEQLDVLTDGKIDGMFDSGEFTGEADSAIMIHNIPELSAERVILAGIGEAGSDPDLDAYRRAAGVVAQIAAKHKLASVAFFYNGKAVADVSQAIVEGMALGSYKFTVYKSNQNAKSDALNAVAVVTPNRSARRQAQNGLERGEITAWAAITARDLGSTPANDLYPESYAKEAQKLAKESGVKCTVFGLNEIKKEKMAAIEAVGRGSERPPRFVILEYKGKGKGAPIVLVGKGITFDTGGLSLKPAAGMIEMKNDMLGSAVVLATICACAKLKVKQNIVGLMPLAENMPSGRATRPSDIIGSRAGLTIEVINTDAEGRLVLADALDYADTFKPQAVIDIATLTGAAIYILGYSGAPFTATNDTLAEGLSRSADTTGEKVWRLPLWPEFADLMKSPVADIKNSAGKTAGTLAAASFLKAFTKDWPWMHIDIAYCDMEPSGKPYVPKGVTGFGARLLIDVLRNWKRPQ